MKPTIICHAIAFIIAITLVAYVLVGCKTTEAVQPPVTAHARAVVGDAATATAEATAASQRSSTHIKAFRSDAERIDYKASRALEILDHQ